MPFLDPTSLHVISAVASCDLGNAPWVSVLVSLSSRPDLGTMEQIGRSILDCNVKTGAVNSRVGDRKATPLL